MTELLLQRYAYVSAHTLGWLWLDDETFVHTIERPWIGGVPGGMPFESCVPDGTYEVVPHQRPNGDDVFALRNPDLHVWHTPAERNNRPGRDLILIHVGNYVDDVVGCIAPGMVSTVYHGRRMVGRSREAMRMVMEAGATGLIIEPFRAENP